MSYNEDCAKIWNPTGFISFEVRPDPFTNSTYDVWAVQSGYARAVSREWFDSKDEALAFFNARDYNQWMEELK
jgi:hypothetical protein